MKRVACPDCDEEHDLEDLEPSYGLPDAVFALSSDERDARAEYGRNWCELKGAGAEPARWFMRTLVPFAVGGREQPCSWGLWVELSQSAFEEIRELWDDAGQ